MASLFNIPGVARRRSPQVRLKKNNLWLQGCSEIQKQRCVQCDVFNFIGVKVFYSYQKISES